MASDGVACLHVSQSSDVSMVPAKENFYSVLHPMGLRNSPHLKVVWALRFEAQQNRASPIWPHIFLKKPLRVQSGDLVQLSWLHDGDE